MRAPRFKATQTCLAIATMVFWVCTVEAGGLGGRSAGGRGGKGVARPSAGARPNVSRPNVSRPNVSRPNVSRPNVSRPNVNRPTMNRPNVGGTNRMPTQRPQTSLPHVGGSAGFSRPNVGQVNPGTSPINRPTTGTSSRPRPSIERPSVDRPSIERPDLSRPAGQPGRPNANLPNRDNVANRPGTGVDRLPGNARPATGNRPSMPDFGSLPSGRPSSGELGDFLGIEQPLRPTRPATRPERPSTRPAERPERPATRPERPATRPERPATRPGNLDDVANRPERPGVGERPSRPDPTTPATRPAQRPGLSNRPDPGNRLPIDSRPSIDVGDINIGNNTIINNKLNWADIDDNRINAIGQRWQNQLGIATTLPAVVPDRLDDWGDAIRDHWYDHRYPGYFRPDWWARHRFRCSGWHYFYAYSYYPYTYWWSTPTYTDVTTWFSWGTPSEPWQQPVYYDYGTGGNVTYQDNRVYIAGEPIATSEEFAQSAATLATVPPPEDQQAAEQAEWMPLGTFALTSDPDDVDPSRLVQLAVNKEGIVSGTLYNSDTDQTQAIQGRVDKTTQRVALRIGESEDVVAETGLYNLTQDEASVLVHFGTETQDTYLLVRLPSPEDPQSEN